jgi:hypothetical protein
MTIKSIIIICIAIIFVYKFFVSPLLIVINPTKLILQNKKIDENMGKQIIPFTLEKNKINKKVVFLLSSIFLLYLVLTVIHKSWINMFLTVVIVSIVFKLYVDQKYSNKNGVYEKGIVFYEFYLWNDMHSWKKMNNYSISILKKDGLRFDLIRNEFNEEIERILLSNGVHREE